MSGAAVPMSLTDRFRRFYATADDARKKIAAAGDGTSGGPTADRVRAPLLAQLEAMDAAREAHPEDGPNLSEGQYAMAAFADDLFGRLDWDGAESWSADTLESRLFRTDKGGTELFKRVDRFLEIGDPGRFDVGRLYLMILALGFGGDLEESSAERTLARYRQRLGDLVAPSGDGPARLTPEAYAHTVGRGAGRLLPNLGRWRWLALGSLALLFAASYYIWTRGTSEIATTVKQILDAALSS